MQHEHLHRSPEALPTTFDVVSTIDSSKLRITLLHPLSHLDISNFSAHAISHKKTVILRQKSAQCLADALSYCVKQTDENGNFLEYGYLSRCEKTLNAYCITALGRDSAGLPTQNELQDRKMSGRPWLANSGAESISLWKCEPAIDTTKVERLRAFSMKSPVVELPPPPTRVDALMISPQSEANPLNFLLSRYYSTLYSLTTPLSYFPKTALARFKIMCGNDRTLMKTNLLSIYLTTEQLEERYNSNFGLEKALKYQAPSPASSSSKYEAENRQSFVSKHLGGSSNEESIRKLVLELKIREAHLQILVLMELMLCWPIDEEQFLLEMPRKQAKLASKNLKQSLVRRKGSKKKIVPTFLGIGVQEFAQSPEKPVNKTVDELTLYTSLIALVDQMGIWETLLGRIKGEKDGLMFGFLAYVLVPFFNNQLPRIVSFVIQKVKELRPKLKVPKSKSSSKSEKQKIKSLDSNEARNDAAPIINVDASDGDSKKKSRFAKVLLSPHQKPFLNRAATTGSELEPAFLLKRSKSNLGAKNLKRRQVDMSLAANNNEPEELKRAKLFLFGDARRVKSVSSATALSQITQVEATPIKKSQSLSTKSSTLLPAPIDKSQVLATPSNVRVLDMQQQIFETPLVSRDSNGFAKPEGRGPSVQEKLARLVPPADSGVKITSSPVRESLDNAPDLFLRSSHAAESSPQFIVTSSPVMPMSSQRKRPGEPVVMSNSPFFKGNLNGLPPSKSGGNLGIFRSRKLVRKGNVTTAKNVPVPTLQVDTTAHESVPNSRDTSQTNTSASSFASTVKSTLSSELLATIKPVMVDTDTDSDSDYDRLLSSVPRPATRKYSRR